MKFKVNRARLIDLIFVMVVCFALLFAVLPFYFAKELGAQIDSEHQSIMIEPDRGFRDSDGITNLLITEPVTFSGKFESDGLDGGERITVSVLGTAVLLTDSIDVEGNWLTSQAESGLSDGVYIVSAQIEDESFDSLTATFEIDNVSPVAQIGLVSNFPATVTEITILLTSTEQLVNQLMSTAENVEGLFEITKTGTVSGSIQEPVGVSENESDFIYEIVIKDISGAGMLGIVKSMYTEDQAGNELVIQGENDESYSPFLHQVESQTFLFVPVIFNEYSPFHNGDFENGLNAWQTTQSSDRQIELGATASASIDVDGTKGDVIQGPIEGSMSALLGDPTISNANVPIGYSELKQTVTITDSANSLSFDFRLFTHDGMYSMTSMRYFDTFEVYVLKSGEPVSEIDTLGEIDTTIRTRYCVDNDNIMAPSEFGLVYCSGNRGIISFNGDPVEVAQLGQVNIDLSSIPIDGPTNVDIVFRLYNRVRDTFNTWVYLDNVELR